MPTKRIETGASTHYSEFYLRDAELCPELPSGGVDLTESFAQRKLKLGDGLIIVGMPNRYFHFFPSEAGAVAPYVPLIVEVHEKEPHLDLESWDHVVDTNIALPSGKLLVGESSISPIRIPRGSYRARIYWGNLHDPDIVDELSEAQLEAVIGTERDHYRVDLWLDPVTETRVLNSVDQ